MILLVLIMVFKEVGYLDLGIHVISFCSEVNFQTRCFYNSSMANVLWIFCRIKLMVWELEFQVGLREGMTGSKGRAMSILGKNVSLKDCVGD